MFVGDVLNNVVREGFVGPPPRLYLALSGGSVVISWPEPGGLLQTNSDLSTPNWSTYGGAVSSSNGTNSVTLTLGSANLYFRITY
jgi:hypothetical protein